MNAKPLTSLEYAGLETLLQRIISAYEDYQNIPIESQTPTSEITERTDGGIKIADGKHDIYQIEGFAIKALYPIDDVCAMAGFMINDHDIATCQDFSIDTLIDVTEFLDEKYIDIDRLNDKIRATQ